MTFRDQVAEEVKEAAENRDSNEQQEVEYIDIEFDETPFVKFYPTTLVSGAFPEDEGNPIIRFPDESNEDGRRDQGYLGFVLDDLSVLTDEEEGLEDSVFVETSDDDTTEYRVVNTADENTKFQYDGDQINIDGDKYDVDDTTTEIDGRAVLVVDRTASVSVARKLDVNGATYAGMSEETGQPNGGLIEYAPDDEDTEVSRRYARNPELREELYGEEIGIMVTRRSEVDDDFAEEIEGDDNRNDMMWYSVFDMETGDTIEPTTGDPIGYSYLEWRFDPTAGHLPDDQWEFVQEYIANGLPTDEDTIQENIENNSDQFDDAPNVERMTRLIENQVTAE